MSTNRSSNDASLTSSPSLAVRRTLFREAMGAMNLEMCLLNIEHLMLAPPSDTVAFRAIGGFRLHTIPLTEAIKALGEVIEWKQDHNEKVRACSRP
jgi:hypothetical protein